MVRVQEGEQRPAYAGLFHFSVTTPNTMYWVYILYSDRIGRFYIGQTNNLENRLARHNDAKRKKLWTHRGIPWTMVAAIPFHDRASAMRDEKRLKSMKSRRVIEEVIAKFPHSVG